MVTSGTFTFDPTYAEFIDEACERVGVDPAELTERHIRTALRSVNLIFSAWSNLKNPEWAIEQIIQPLTQGDVTYEMPTGALAVTSMVLRTTTGGNIFDTEMFPISRRDYLRIADPDIEGRPTQYFMDRERTVPTLFLWNSPESDTYSIVYNYVRRLQDVGTLSNTADLPFRWFEAICAELAARLYPKLHSISEGKYDINVHNKLEAAAIRSYKEATYEDSDKSPTRIRINFNRHRRRR